MIIVKIIGGLGNQIFQYAYAKSLQQKGYEVKIDISAFETYKLHGGYQLDKYNIDLPVSTKEENDKFCKNNITSKILKKLGFDFSKKTQEKSLLFDNTRLNIEDDDYIEGYFQSEKYFKDIRDIILKQFVINQVVLGYTKEIEYKILSSQNSCSLHIRRGDFINSKNISIHGVCDVEYYINSMQYIEGKAKDINYFIFSDDMEWVKESLTIERAIYIESEEKRIPHEDVYLMSLCHHNIIANSSFSWWGAWLNQNKEKIVIAPKNWYADEKLESQSGDVVCESWVRV